MNTLTWNILWNLIALVWVISFRWFEDWKLWLVWIIYCAGWLFVDAYVAHRGLAVRVVDTASMAFAIFMFLRTKPPDLKDKLRKLIGAKSQALIDALTRKQAEQS